MADMTLNQIEQSQLLSLIHSLINLPLTMD